MNAHASRLLLLGAALLLGCRASAQDGPPEPPQIKVVIWDEGVFDVYQGGIRKAIEEFKIRRREDGSGFELSGKVTVAIQAAGGETDVFSFHPMLEYGARGADKYYLRAKFPHGTGDVSVGRDGGKCVAKVTMPGQEETASEVPLPVHHGFIVDKRAVHHWGIFGTSFFRGVRKPMVLDADTLRVAEIRFSEPEPACLESWDRSIVCERVLATQGAVGTNLWFDLEGKLLRMEAPLFGIVAVRRGAYGVPSSRAPYDPPPAALGGQANFQDGGFLLAGELTQPAGNAPFPCVMILSTAGPQDRDGNPPAGATHMTVYRDIARILTDAGIAVLRWDDPGTGFSIAGKDNPTISDFISNARAAVKWLKNQPTIDPKRIGALGHGEGSIIALQLLSNGEISFAALLAPHSAPVGSIVLDQIEWEWKRMGEVEGRLKAYIDEQRELQRLFLDPKVVDWKEPAVPPQFLLYGGMRDWYRDIAKFDPIELAKKAEGPVFAATGRDDCLVPVKHLEALQKACAEAKKDATFCEIAGVDHYFMRSVNGEPGDTAHPYRNVQADDLRPLVEWLKKR